MTNNVDNSPVEDSFPDKHIFEVSFHSPWYAYIANYDDVGNLPLHLSKRERRRIVQQSPRYCWIEGYLFYIRTDLEIRRCVRGDEIHSILKACHDKNCGGALC